MSHTYLLNGTTTPAIVAGSVTAVLVSQDAVWIVFHNVSVNQDILLSLGVSNPGPTSTPGGEWPYVCPAGHSVKVPVPGTSKTQTAVDTYWQGKIWVLPINQTSQQAVTGKQPPIGNLWIMTFATGETPAEVSPNSTGVTELGQQRVIALPPTPGAHSAIIASPSVGDTSMATGPLTAAQIAALSIYGYTFGLDVRVAVPAVSTQVGLTFEWHLDILNVSSTIIASVLIWTGFAWSGQGAAGSGVVNVVPWTRLCPNPEFTLLSGFGGTGTQWQWRFRVTAISGTPSNTVVTWAAEVDQSNPTATPGPYGNNFYLNTPGNF